MLEFEKYKDEIIKSIEDLKDETILTNDLLEDYFNLDNSIENEEEISVEDELLDVHTPAVKRYDKNVEDLNIKRLELEQLHDDYIDIDYLSEINMTNWEIYENLELLNITSEQIVIELETLNENIDNNSNFLIEGFWVVSITIIIALGFHYFINQFSKW